VLSSITESTLNEDLEVSLDQNSACIGRATCQLANSRVVIEAIGLKTIGKAGKAVTHKIGKTLTKIGESPDKRGHERLFFLQNPQFLSRDRPGQQRAPTAALKSDLGLDTGRYWLRRSVSL
jgi:hypothetical protein